MPCFLCTEFRFRGILVCQKKKKRRKKKRKKKTEWKGGEEGLLNLSEEDEGHVKKNQEICTLREEKPQAFWKSKKSIYMQLQMSCQN